MLNFPKPDKVMEYIESWRNIDLRNKSDDEVDELLTNLIESLRVISVSGSHTKPHKLWRVRKCNDFYTAIDEFWSPPPEKTKAGRCNKANDPVLYVSDNKTTAIEELELKPFTPFYLIEYKARKPLKLAQVISDDLNPTNIETNEPIYRDYELLSYQILREFIRSEFIRPVGTGTEYLHKISASICRVWFGGDDIDGWIYPSVAKFGKKNFAIKPTVAKEKLKIATIKIAMLIPAELATHDLNENDPTVAFFHNTKYNVREINDGNVSDGTVSWRASTRISCSY